MGVLAECNSCKRVFRDESDLLDGTSCFKICDDQNLWFECSCNSAIMIPEGEYNWYDQEFFMGNQSKSVFKKIEDLKDLPRVSSDIMRIQKLMENENCDATALEKEIKSVPPIALNLIDIANKMSVGSEITSLKHAIGYIGNTRLKQIIYFAGIKSYKFKTESFDQNSFWRQCSLAGLTAEYLAKKFNPSDKVMPEQAYFSASMANIGKVVAAILFPETTDKISQALSKPGCNQSWSAIESGLDAPDHAILGEIAGTIWGLPSYAMRTIRFHNSTPQEYRHEVKNGGFLFDEEPEPEDTQQAYTLHEIVCLGIQYSHWINSEPHRINNRVFEAFLEKMNLDGSQRDQLGQELSDHFRPVLAA